MTQFLRESLEWLFWTPPNRISHCVDILWGSCSQLSTTCWFLSFFGGLYQCSCVLELFYPAINLELRGTVIEIKPSVVSGIMISSPDRGSHKMFFPLLTMPSPWSSEMLFYFLSTLKNNNINIGGVINLQLGHVYNKTLCMLEITKKNFHAIFTIFQKVKLNLLISILWVIPVTSKLKSRKNSFLDRFSTT